MKLPNLSWIFCFSFIKISFEIFPRIAMHLRSQQRMKIGAFFFCFVASCNTNYPYPANIAVICRFKIRFLSLLDSHWIKAQFAHPQVE